MKSSSASLHGSYFDLLKAKYPDLAPEAGRPAEPEPRRRSLTPWLLMFVGLAGVGCLVIASRPDIIRGWTSTPEPEVVGRAAVGIPETVPVPELVVAPEPVVVPEAAVVQEPVVVPVAEVVPEAIVVPESVAVPKLVVVPEVADAQTRVADSVSRPPVATGGRPTDAIANQEVLAEAAVPVGDELVGVELVGVELVGVQDLAAMATTEMSVPLTATSLGSESIRSSSARSGQRLAGPPAARSVKPPSPASALSEASASPAIEQGPYEVGGAVKPPRRLVAPLPKYPDAAWAQGITGDVLVRAIIDEEGKVSDINVLRGLPYGMTDAAVEAMRRWRFAPATRHGAAVPVYRNLSVRFES